MFDRATESRRGWSLPSRALPAILLLGFVIGGLGACVDEDAAFDRPSNDEPPETVNNFLGYVGDPADQWTSCGNCHATFQGGWETTGHAHAWAGLQSSDHAEEFCEGCHTVSELGNPLTEPAGHNLVRDPRYRDVQCESCHGSGWDHVNNPNVANAPLCSVEAATDATTGCGECHQGTHHPFVEQWEESGHANTSFASGRSGCDECHEGKKALVYKFFETSNYLEKDDPTPQPIMCAVCHDPHGTDFEGNLRAPIDVIGGGTDLPPTDHLCYRCHSRRGTPPSDHGPHAAQGPLVLQSDVGWLPAGFQVPPLGGHGDPSRNEKLCVTCHVAEYEFTDQSTGGTFTSVGHLFEALPCLDPVTGLPVGGGDCDLSEKTFVGCTECHSEATARGLLAILKDDLSILLDSLWVDTDENHIMDATDAGLLPQIIARAEFNPADTVQLDPRDGLITVAEGVMWNAQLGHTSDEPWYEDAVVYFGIAGEDGDPDDPENQPDGTPDGIHWSAHKASGNGVHNPKFLKDLLRASINALLDEYFSR